jgi:hypothetical protein
MDPSSSELAGSSEGALSTTPIPRATSLATALDALLIERPTSSLPSTLQTSGKHPSSSRQNEGETPLKHLALTTTVEVGQIIDNPSQQLRATILSARWLLELREEDRRDAYNIGLQSNQAVATLTQQLRSANGNLSEARRLNRHLQSAIDRYELKIPEYQSEIRRLNILLGTPINDAFVDPPEYTSLTTTSAFNNTLSTTVIASTSGSSSKQPLLKAGPYNQDTIASNKAKINFLTDQLNNNFRLSSNTKTEIRAAIQRVEAFNMIDNDHETIIQAAQGARDKLLELCHLCIGGKEQVRAAHKAQQAEAADIDLPDVPIRVNNYFNNKNSSTNRGRGSNRGRSSRGSGRAGRSNR